DHPLRAGFAPHETGRLVMITMRVADEYDLDVLVREPELLDDLFEQGDILFEVSIEQDMPLVRRDQITREVGRANVIDVAGDSKGREFPVPIGIALRQQGRRSEKERDDYRAQCHASLPRGSLYTTTTPCSREFRFRHGGCSGHRVAKTNCGAAGDSTGATLRAW